MSIEVSISDGRLKWLKQGQDSFDPKKIHSFKPFPRGAAVFGGHFGDEGKGKQVDSLAEQYKKDGYKILSIRGQGSGNAGHTVIVDDKQYDFHYLTSAGLSADIMLLGPGMLIDPARVLSEAENLPEEKRNIIMIAERASIVTDLERSIDGWYENYRTGSGKSAIGTTGSGVGPGVGRRGNRTHVTFADALMCKDAEEFKSLYLSDPSIPSKIMETFTTEYAEYLWKAIHKLTIVDSNSVIQNCRVEGNWAVLLEVSQAVCLDNLQGNGGHNVTSMPCTDIGGATGAGLTMYDFPDGSTMMLKAYSSKVGGGPFITKFDESEKSIDDFIDNMVGEHGVTTGRKRDLGWFDGPAIRHSIQCTGCKTIAVNCMDVIAELPSVTDSVKVCYAYKQKFTGEVTYDWPYNLDDYIPLYITMNIKFKKKSQIIEDYLLLLETVIGQKINKYGTGPSREDFKDRK